MMMGPESTDEYLKLPDSRERDKILSFRKIGILDAGAIGNAKKKRGPVKVSCTCILYQVDG